MKRLFLAACLSLAACGSARAQPDPDPGNAMVTITNPGQLQVMEKTRSDGGKRMFVDIQGRRVPQQVFADPPRDAGHPASNRQLLIASGGEEMNALFFLAAGAGPKPTLLLLHGLPGNERNLDLAQAVRRAGWNVLTFTYRGAWGSQGRFSIANALDDTKAALAFLRSDAAVRDYGIDRSRIVVAGHSMGGYAAASTAANDAWTRTGQGPGPVAGVVLLDAWPIGETAAQVKAAGAPGRQALIANFDDLGHALGPVTAADIADELEQRGASWTLAPLVPRLARLPVLTVYATGGLAAGNKAIAGAIRKVPGARVTEVALESDHAFADKRIALAAEVVQWLEALD